MAKKEKNRKVAASAKLRRRLSPGSLKMRTENFSLNPIIRRSPRNFCMCTFGEVEEVKVGWQRLK